MFRNLVKYFKFLVGIFPIVSIISIATISIVIYVESLIPINYLPWDRGNIAEILIVLCLVTYGIKRKKLIKNSYFILLIITIMLFCCGVKVVIIFQPALLIAYSIFIESKLSKIKTFFEDNVGVLFGINIVYVLALIVSALVKNIDSNVINKQLYSFYELLQSINLSENAVNNFCCPDTYFISNREKYFYNKKIDKRNRYLFEARSCTME